MGFFQRLFPKREAAHEPSPPPLAGRLKIEEFGHNLVSIDALDFIGHQAVSPNKRYRLIDIVARIEQASPRHKQHCGEQIGITLACAQTYNEEGRTPTSDKPFLLNMNLRKNNRSFMAYLPTAAFWAIPRMIDTGRITHVHAMFAPLHRGDSELLSVYLIPESKLDEL